MSDGKSFDVLIVGAGPAGASAARAAAMAGANVVVIEKRRKIGEPVQCAEYIPRLLTREVKIPREAIAQEIQGMTTFIQESEIVRKRAPGFILHRQEFDKALAMEASKAGAKILTETKALSKKGNKVKTLNPSGEDEIESSVIIGADGPDSLVGSWIGQKNRKFMCAMQHTVILKQASYDTEVYFSREYPGGYAWLFPKGETANVGVGVLSELGGVAKQALGAFKERIKDRIGDVIGITAGRIPVGGPLHSIDGGARIMLVGDAAGHTHAITGGGIPLAVICGAMAGRAAAAYSGGDKEAIQDYYYQWRAAFGAILDRAARKREELVTGWSGSDLTELLKRCWVSFGEYYHDS
ncbi:MAG: NAD(P)/FAD-dependent oxidoreductase [Proteobacteria bacterium]|nr:NAD(P)/FAD-dependent oxidoreductase [Pseudomonadota bacterium]MBU1903861.1 NAD(P)/FAD-dependent oxidoreductase [Pseudomonadota bacterium]